MFVAQHRNFEEIPTSYSPFFARQGATSVFLTKPWFENLVSNGIDKRTNTHLIALEDSGSQQPRAALAMRSPAGQDGSIFSGWRLGARTLAGLTSFQSSYYAPLLDPSLNDRTELFNGLAKALSAQVPQWDLIDFNILDPDHESFNALPMAFEKYGFRAQKYVYKGNWFEDITAQTFDEYVKQRPKSPRRAIQNYQRKLRKLQATKDVKFKVYTGDDDLEEIVSNYEKIHALSWKEPEDFGRFSPGLIRACASQGSLRIGFLFLDDVPVAVEFAIVLERKAVMMKTAYDPDYTKESVGAIVILKTIEHLINEDGITSMDFGLDDDPYKLTWVQNRRERWGLVLFNRRTAMGWFYWLRYLTREADQKMRDLLKSGLAALRQPKFVQAG